MVFIQRSFKALSEIFKKASQSKIQLVLAGDSAQVETVGFPDEYLFPETLRQTSASTSILSNMGERTEAFR